VKKTAKVLNWLMLTLFGVTFIGLSVQYPGAVSGSFILLLLPYASALLAFNTKPNQVLNGGAIFLNALMVVISIAYLVIGMRSGQSLNVLVAAVLLLPSPVLNCVVLKWAWDRGRALAKNANKRLQSTRPPQA
jgi:hypothetical protein